MAGETVDTDLRISFVLPVYLPIGDSVCQDPMLRTEYMVIKGDKRTDLKEFRRQHSLRALSFASSDDLAAIMGLPPGSVIPPGILNDSGHRVHFYLDVEFVGNKIDVHPNDNTATAWIQAEDLLRLIQEHGNEAKFTRL